MSYTLDPTIAEHVVVPLGDRVLVLVDAVREQKVGSLFVPETAKDKKYWGTVQAVGPEFQVRDDALVAGDEPWIVRQGDRVLYARYGGYDVELPDGRQLLLLREEDVLAKLGEARDVAA